MDNKRQEAMGALGDDMDKQLGVLQFQVLNNLDALAGQEGKLDPEMLNRMVKRPLMLAVTALRKLKGRMLLEAFAGYMPRAETKDNSVQEDGKERKE